MSNDLMRKQSKNILNAINNFVSNTGLNDVKTSFDSKTGIASVIGNKDGFSVYYNVDQTYEWRSANDNAICYQFGKGSANITN